MEYLFAESKSVSPEELSALFTDVGWGQQSAQKLQRSIDAYPFVAHARTETGLLVGYISAFSDEVFSTLLGELVVHPDYQRKGIATNLLARLEARFPSAPVYIKALGEAKKFFVAQGYKAPRIELTVLFKSPSSTCDA
ncbi:GNAT family N-acetyltransferase [Stutzerimonas stutzeri]|uniref:GNAT family N-acetyltransferase n=1 Tax=Stutzerimonas stutzeri TaxID=316 RepID=UPI0031D36E2F